MPLKVYSRRIQPALRSLHAPTIHPDKDTENQTTSTSNDISDFDLPIALRKEKRQCTQYPLSNFVSFDNQSSSYQAFVSKLSSIKIPKPVRKALRNENWKKAILEEMRALKKNNTWELVNLPKGKTKVGCKWVFTTKHRANGTLERYKVRLVAKGYTQTHEIDYQETFALVAKMNIVRILLSLATNFDWPLQQFDVKNAFLHGDLEEELYMELPPGFIKDSMRKKVCRLNKALYGLKQSLRAWFGRFAKAMKNMGYSQSQGITLSSLDIQRREG